MGSLAEIDLSLGHSELIPSNPGRTWELEAVPTRKNLLRRRKQLQGTSGFHLSHLRGSTPRIPKKG